MLTVKPRLPLKDILLVGMLPSPLKKLVYRLKGHRIGRHVQIGATTFLDTPHIEIGEGTKINEQVFVGGLQFPDSRFVVGRNCQIMQRCFINPARSIRMGDDSGIGGDCLLFGHTSWLSKFEGYPVEFEPIEIGSSVSLAWRVFVLCGAKIGDGAVIGANSLVRGTIPARCLAVGFPARVVSKAPELPREVGEAEKQQILREIVTEMFDYFRGFGLECRQDGDRWIVARTTRRLWSTTVRSWRLQVEEHPLSDSRGGAAPGGVDVFVSLWRIPDPLRKDLNRNKTTWIDIECKERSDHGNELGEEVILYLRRYGVRLLRWRGNPTSPSAAAGVPG